MDKINLLEQYHINKPKKGESFDSWLQNNKENFFRMKFYSKKNWKFIAEETSEFLDLPDSLRISTLTEKLTLTLHLADRKFKKKYNF